MFQIGTKSLAGCDDTSKVIFVDSMLRVDNARAH